MLLTLRLRNFALAEQVEMEFTTGLNVLTGETGAGKSILLDALGLCLGNRASSDMVRSGCDTARVQALFDIGGNKQLQALLQAWGLENEEDDVLLVDREVSRNGRNRCYINGQLATVTMLRNCSKFLVDIYGQHDHMLLRDNEYQLQLLDLIGGAEITEQKAMVHKAYQSLQTTIRELQRFEKGSQALARELDLLRFQVNEISAAQLQESEEQELITERRRLLNQEKITETLARVGDLLHGSSQEGLMDVLGDVVRDLEDLAGLDDDLRHLHELLSNVYYQLEEAAFSLSDYLDNQLFEPERLDIIEERLHVIAGLKRKYGDTIADILEYMQKAQQELELLENSEEHLFRLRQQKDELQSAYHKQALKLSKLRQRVANDLQAALVTQLRQLGMLHADFVIKVEYRDNLVTENGSDSVQFLFSANQGEPPKPMSRIASGGELSRIMLGLKACTAGVGLGAGCMIFDEIDAGVGGLTAKAVADKLEILATERQVLCVTHQPVIAARAKRHFMVFKESAKGRTVTKVKPLKVEERIQEIARMLGGSAQDDATRRHAQSLLKLT